MLLGLACAKDAPIVGSGAGRTHGGGAMDLLAQYSDDDGSAGQDAVAAAPSMKIDAAPEVSGADPRANKRRTLGSLSPVQSLQPRILTLGTDVALFPPTHFAWLKVNTAGLTLALDNKVVRQGEQASYQDPTTRVVYQNFRYEEMYAPSAGPTSVHDPTGLNAGQRNHPLGYMEKTHISDFNFNKEYTSFHTTGSGQHPSEKRTVTLSSPTESRRPAKLARTTPGPSEPPAAEQVDEEEEEEDPFEWRGSKTPWQERAEQATEYTEEQKKILREREEKDKAEAAEQKRDVEQAREDKSFFHGKSERDYAGRSWVEPPKHLKKENDHCYVPKRLIHTWSGHSKCVQAIRFFPGTGHLLLSAGMDTKIKIWDVSTTRKCMRSYLGHGKAVRDICFSNDGRKFLSTGYDRNLKLWDTETGQVIRTLSSGKALAYCVKFNPDDDKQNMVLAGCSDKKIYQFDTDSGEIVQEYSEHMGAVNSITFVDENRRFVSSSDDKSLRVWDFGIPVQIKYIADPSMHSMPSVAAHPNGNFIVGQSLDNTIQILSTKDRFKMNHKRVFRGHNSAGYACQVNFSPDGRFVISGDAEGRCFFWDWKSSRVFRKLRCHQGACMGVEWHPLETSKVATCGYDGLIKYYD